MLDRGLVISSTKLSVRAPQWLSGMVGIPKFSQKGDPHLNSNSRLLLNYVVHFSPYPKESIL